MGEIIAINGLDADAQFFMQHPDRHAHIRDAKPQEYSGEFFSLGPHDMDRRRIILWRGPKGTELAGRIVKIPFLAFADETIEDTDKVLVPMINQIMMDEAKRYGFSNG